MAFNSLRLSNLRIPRLARNEGQRKIPVLLYATSQNGGKRIKTGLTYLSLFAAALLLILPSLSIAAGPASKKITFLQKNGKPGPCTFVAEIAVTPAEQERGLMFREHLDADGGMLFDFSGDEMRYFWMRNTLIPLDMIFIGSDLKVVHVHRWARPKDETGISSKLPARYVLEINGGRAAACRIEPGLKVRFISPSP